MEARSASSVQPLRWLLVVVVIGLCLRAYHYLRMPSLWHDEAALIVNALELDFVALLGPLIWAEAAPPLFLWLQRAVALLAGDDLLTLRAPAFIASCGTLVLFAALARRLLHPLAAIAATALLGVSDMLLWHACEAKPYAVDAFLAVLLMGVHVWSNGWPATRRFLLHALLVPFVIFLSYPGAFLCGASLLALLPAAWRERKISARLAYVLLVSAVVVSFGVLVLGPARAQRCAAMDSCWTGHFPNWNRAWYVPVWSLVQTLEVFRYCFRPLGQVLAFFALVGGALWWRQRRELLILASVPLLLALVASVLGRYPYGGTRLEIFAAPGLALLIGVGLPAVWAWLSERRRWTPALIVVALGLPLLSTLHNIIRPWHRPDCTAASLFVLERLQPGDVVVAQGYEQVYHFRRQREAFILVGLPDGQMQPPGYTIRPINQIAPTGRCWVIGLAEQPGAEPLVFRSLWYLGLSEQGRWKFKEVSVGLASPAPSAKPDAERVSALTPQ